MLLSKSLFWNIKTLIRSILHVMYWCVHKTSTLTSIQHTTYAPLSPQIFRLFYGPASAFQECCQAISLWKMWYFLVIEEHKFLARGNAINLLCSKNTVLTPLTVVINHKNLSHYAQCIHSIQEYIGIEINVTNKVENNIK